MVHKKKKKKRKFNSHDLTKIDLNIQKKKEIINLFFFIKIN